MKIIDAKGCVLGRVGSRVAKMLLTGEEVALVNAGEAVLSGNPQSTTEKFIARRSAKNRANPEHSPHWPRRPDLLVRRMLRGMLPYRTTRGRLAFKRLKVYTAQPAELSKAEVLEMTSASKLRTDSITINELCKNLGYRVGR
ncbi:MAG: 50S ribosomal protein L13 [Candidatus Micrarchaeota archaeon]